MKIPLAILLFPLICNAQEQATVLRDTIIKKDMALILSNDSIIQIGTAIKCGRGTLPNGDFKYIHTSSSSWAAMMSASQADPTAGIQPIGRRYSGLFLTVKSVKQLGSKKRGYKYILKVGGGNIVNYEVEIEDALAAGEIIERVPPSVTTLTTTPAADGVDELKKLKDLYDSGALTKDEYDSAKKKILAKM
jgi:hypothetical protein